uniref:Uncharacterized protein n=1 Tax=Coccidioides posadasii RMSCC 3488 TaxID=454284 RepID=A0A0J6FKS1_COCPO|nr:hypothetical protein CPAG_06348 [Coccidioides posadasii RMSCC 3488]
MSSVNYGLASHSAISHKGPYIRLFIYHVKMRPSFVSLRSRSGHPVHIYTVGGDVTRATGDLILDLGGQQSSRWMQQSSELPKARSFIGRRLTSFRARPKGLEV